MNVKLTLVITVFVLIWLSLIPRLCYAQAVADTAEKASPGGAYYESLDTTINVKLNVNSEFEMFEVKTDDLYYDIRPNISLSSRISVNYRFISFGIGLTPKFIPGNNDNEMKGKTKAFSMGLSISTSGVLQELQLLHVKGFYLHNTGDFDPAWTQGEDPYVQFPDLDVIAIRGATGYKVNKKFSMNSIRSQTEIQLKSCGSLFPYLIYDYYRIDDQSTGQASSQRSINLEAIASLGYSYTFVSRRGYYASVGIIPGLGYHFTNLLTRMPTGDTTSKQSNMVFRSGEKIGLGYNTKKLFAGLEVIFSQSIHNQGITSVKSKSYRTTFQVFVGYRFNAPRIVKHETDVIKETVPKKFQKIIE